MERHGVLATSGAGRPAPFMVEKQVMAKNRCYLSVFETRYRSALTSHPILVRPSFSLCLPASLRVPGKLSTSGHFE